MSDHRPLTAGWPEAGCGLTELIRRSRHIPLAVLLATSIALPAFAQQAAQPTGDR